jgi:hypothetical protein
VRVRAFLSAIVVMVVASRAGAQIDAAADAYDRGVAAHARGDHKTAAREFARADELVPSDGALDAALDACDKCDEALLCTRVAARAERTTSAALRAKADGVRRRFAARVGQIEIACAAPCNVLVDGEPVEVGAVHTLLSGQHRVVAVRDGRRDERNVEVPAGTRLEVMFVAPPKSVPVAVTPLPPPPRRSGISPAWVVLGAGVTAVGFGVAGWSWIDARDTKDEFSNAGCGAAGSDRCDALAADGRDALVRTNVILVASSVVALATVTLALFFTEWKSRPTSGRAAAITF